MTAVMIIRMMMAMAMRDSAFNSTSVGQKEPGYNNADDDPYDDDDYDAGEQLQF